LKRCEKQAIWQSKYFAFDGNFVTLTVNFKQNQFPNMEKEIFITEIDINKVHNLENVQIVISDTERKHLILTGKNGSGKTSVLEAIKAFLEKGIEQNLLNSGEQSLKMFTQNASNIKQMETQLRETKLSPEEILNIEMKIKATFEQNNKIFNQNSFYLMTHLRFSDVMKLYNLYQSNSFLLAYFSSQRNNEHLKNNINIQSLKDLFRKPIGVSKFNLPTKTGLNTKVGHLFVQHLVNLHFDILEAKEYEEQENVMRIKHWFTNFEKSLQNILDEPQLKLEYERKERTYKLKLGNGLTVDFNELSDGYSSILIIVAELMMRMEAMNARNYDLQGIVLIDEIETHLHIDLQKKILPFLTTFFPKIQFIVTTHSPFVLNSVANSVVFDLEKQIRMDDAYLYSAAGIVEGYFEDDAYSLNPKQLEDELNEYEILIQKPNLTDDENEEVLNLRRKFKNIPENMAIDIVLRFEQAEINRLTLKK
jgi:predicted ATP-binding protein involved in virulence